MTCARMTFGLKLTWFRAVFSAQARAHMEQKNACEHIRHYNTRSSGYNVEKNTL